MANVVIYNGDVTFSPGMTMLGYYDNDPQFQIDVVAFTHLAAHMLGYEVVKVELNNKNFFAAYESAINEYANAVYRAKIQDNYINYEGNSSSSVLNDKLTVPSLGSIIRIAKTYGSEAGSGGLVDYHSGSIKIEAGRQNYSLKQWAYLSGSLAPGDSIEIKRIFNQGVPASVRWLDPGFGVTQNPSTAIDVMGWSNMGIPINYMMTPVSQDVARFQAVEFNDEIRRSAYSFELINNELKIFPIPQYDGKLWFQYIKVSERDSSTNIGSGNNSGLITNPANVPFTHITYSSINAPGVQWIQAFALANCKLILANVRGKYGTIDIPGSVVTLNSGELIQQATEEKNRLLESLQLFLDNTSRRVQLERQAAEADYVKQTLGNIPMNIYIG